MVTIKIYNASRTSYEPMQIPLQDSIEFCLDLTDKGVWWELWTNKLLKIASLAR